MSTSTPQSAVNTDAVGSNRWYLSAAPIVRALVHLCVPMAAAMIVGAVYNLINAGFIGSLHNTALLAAITFGTPILGLVMAVGGVFGVGGGAQISRLMGAAEHDPAKAGEIKRVSAFAFWGSAIAGAVFGGAGLLLLHPLVTLLGAVVAAAAATRSFVAVMLAFVPVLAAAFCLEQLVRAEGAARQAMIGLIGSTIANLVFDVLFILVLHWGVAGAALSIGLANLAVVVYFAVWLARHSEHVSLAPRWVTLSPSVWKPVFGVGVGELLQSAFMILILLVLNNLAAHYGDGPLAAMGVAVRIAQIPEFLIMGITLGVLPLLAYSYGKGDRSRLTSALRASAYTVGGISVLFAVAVFVFRDQVFTAFVADRSVLGIGYQHPHRAVGGDDRQRLHRTDHLAVPGSGSGAGGDGDVGVAGRAVHPDRAVGQPLVRAHRHYLGADRHRKPRTSRRPRPLAGFASRHRSRPGAGQPRTRRRSPRAGRRLSAVPEHVKPQVTTSPPIWGYERGGAAEYYHFLVGASVLM